MTSWSVLDTPAFFPQTSRLLLLFISLTQKNELHLDHQNGTDLFVLLFLHVLILHCKLNQSVLHLVKHIGLPTRTLIMRQS